MTKSIFQSEIRFVEQTQSKRCCFAIKTTTQFVLLILFFLSVGGIKQLMAQQSKIDSLYYLLATSKEDTNKINVLVRLGESIHTIDSNKGILHIKQGLQLSNKIKEEKFMSLCFASLGSLYSLQSKYDSALIYFQKRYEIELKNKSKRSLAQACLNLGTTYSHIGSVDKATFFFNDAINYYYAIGDKDGLAYAYFGLGNAIQAKGSFDSAIEYCNKSIELYKELRNEKEIGRPYLSLSYLYTFLGKLDLAEYYANKAKEIAEISNDKFLKCNTLQVFGSIYIKKEKYRESNKFLIDAKKIAEELQNKYLISLSVKRIGINYANLNDTDNAIKYFNEALQIAELTGDLTNLAEINQNLGYLYLSTNQHSMAISYFDQSDKFSYADGNNLILMSNSRDKLETYCALNKPDSVLKYFNRYLQFSDSINTKKNSKAIAEMQTKYETEKKDKEILVLNLEAQKKKNTVWAVSSGAALLFVISLSGFVFFHNRKKREQAVLLQTISETDIKALRAQMNPHFIFNCIHTIDSLLDDSKIQESKDCLIKFATLTRSVLENSNKREISLAEELMVLSAYMDLENTRLATPFVYQIETAKGLNSEVTLIPPLILQPFVENAIKHGFEKISRPGQIKIAIHKENDLLVCTVEDNGSGRNPDMANKPGAAFKKESMGIKLSEDRLRLLGEMKNRRSDFTIEDLIDKNNKPAGTRVKMHLPFEQEI